MKKHFYAFSRDFRGAPAGWQKIEGMNFLVGENSTGKSSFVKLADLVGDPRFLISLDPFGLVDGVDTEADVISRITGADSVTLGHLLGIERENPDGHLDSEGREAPRVTVHSRLVTYKRGKDGLKIIRLTQLVGSNFISLRFLGTVVRRRAEPLPSDQERNLDAIIKKIEDLHFSTRRHTTIDDLELSDPDYSDWASLIMREYALLSNSSARSLASRIPRISTLQYGPFRGRPLRIYHGGKNEFSSTGEHVPYTLRDMAEKNRELNQAINAFGKESGLFDSLSITSISSRIPDKPFALEIERDGRFYYLGELGFGTGQILPIVADIFASPPSYIMLIQQPELHLHPRAQAAFGEVLYHAVKAGRTMIVETHSDFVIDRFRLLQKRDVEVPAVGKIMYFSICKDTGCNRMNEIKLDRGALTSAPDGYKDFFINESLEQMDLL